MLAVKILIALVIAPFIAYGGVLLIVGYIWCVCRAINWISDKVERKLDNRRTDENHGIHHRCADCRGRHINR